ncbi:hypothetical protein [Terribacillus saccharophilus]|nr:hypothetical protein [Terribacillus goriensis]
MAMLSRKKRKQEEKKAHNFFSKAYKTVQSINALHALIKAGKWVKDTFIS